MQKLGRRDTYTPRNTPHVPGNCDPVLNSSERARNSVPDLKTQSNSPDVALTAKGQAEHSKVCVVYVLNMYGKPLMTTTPRKCRILLRDKKAKVVKRTPFTIQLNYPCGGAVQPVKLGMDSGFNHIGLSAVSENKELFSAEIMLRTDMVKLNSERRSYRRTRRNRKTWYRKPRFLNRKKEQGWLAPSIRNKFESHIKAVNMVKSVLPVSEVSVEVAAFDIQKIKNPDINGREYQNGEQTGFWNVRECVLHRDKHKCQHCKGKREDPVLNVHHIKSRQTGGDRPDNLITLCETCHNLHHKGEIEVKTTKVKGFRAETFMSVVRWKLVNTLKDLFPELETGFTFGYITKSKRIKFGLGKSHVNDAFVIAGGVGSRCQEYLIKQVRKSNRKLFKGIRSHIKNTAPRFIKGYQRFDKVLWQGLECFIFGRRTTGYFDLRTLDGTKIHASAKVKDLRLLESAKTFLIQERPVSSLT